MVHVTVTVEGKPATVLMLGADDARALARDLRAAAVVPGNVMPER
jgi:hypothetical protein